jgi:2-amino-4-hydroxy-6-hydroxymethyldihydropteridine diphosphokinase
VIAYIGLGNNLGQRRRIIEEALDLLGKEPQIEVLRVSDLKETSPLGGMAQPSYLNGVAEIRTALTAEELLATLKATEDSLGRERRERWGPRTIDLDLLLYGHENIRLPGLIVPHPQMHLRSFVLDGLCQLNPTLVHPLLGESVCELAGRLGGADFALTSDAPRLVSIAGLIGVGKTTLAERLAAILTAEILREPYDTNPFLPRVYAGQKELGLASQLYFLVHRSEQLNPDVLSSQRVSLSDYVFDQELIYARRCLETDQWQVYRSIFPRFAEKVATPALVIYLQDSPANCLERIHRRKRPYEQGITLAFLESLHGDYERLFGDWNRCPVIRLPASKVEPGDSAAAEHLALQVEAYVTAPAVPGRSPKPAPIT